MLEKKLDENQPREQAGFRSKYSTTDHIHAINQLKEKCREYNIPLCVAFLDYEKAFDSVQTKAILTSLQEQGIEDVYIEILKDIYTDSSVTVHLHKESEKIRIKRGVRQGDTISPKLFTATLESIFRRLNWENKGVKIDGEFLSNLRFADDIFLCTETPQELQHMLQELSDESRRMGLKMNIAKTKVMVVDNTPINVNNVLIETVNIETLKAGDETIAKQLAKLYTMCITERRIPKTWKEANMVIFFNKGNRRDIKNYRPICLLSNMYKLFTTIITTRLEKKLDENQPREQAAFRSKYATTDHIHAINQLKEKCREYNIPLCVAFVDYEKAFDSVQTKAILTSLQEQGIEDVYIEILKDIYTDSSVTVHLHKESEKIRIKRGVRQGDTISPKLFTATLESII